MYWIKKLEWCIGLKFNKEISADQNLTFFGLVVGQNDERFICDFEAILSNNIKCSPILNFMKKDNREEIDFDYLKRHLSWEACTD